MCTQVRVAHLKTPREIGKYRARLLQAEYMARICVNRQGTFEVRYNVNIRYVEVIKPQLHKCGTSYFIIYFILKVLQPERTDETGKQARLHVGHTQAKKHKR